MLQLLGIPRSLPEFLSGQLLPVEIVLMVFDVIVPNAGYTCRVLLTTDAM